MYELAQAVSDVDVLLKLDPEQMGAKLLFLLRKRKFPNGIFHPGNLEKELWHSSTFPGQQTPYPRDRESHISRAWAEAWAWLEGERLVVPAPGTNGSHGWRMLSRRAETFKDEPDLLRQIGMQGPPHHEDALSLQLEPANRSDRPPASQEISRKVFVVHGHDEAAREKVARFLERLELQPIILHEQASRGRTVIEKVEAHSEVGFAVVLLTPDDEGCEKGKMPRPRPRQNVVLELGYFIGRLGRTRVCALKRGDIEIPSDFQGVVYVDFDNSDGWKQALGKELEAAGLPIDWAKAMGAQ